MLGRKLTMVINHHPSKNSFEICAKSGILPWLNVIERAIQELETEFLYKIIDFRTVSQGHR